jgi:TolB-like protein
MTRLAFAALPFLLLCVSPGRSQTKFYNYYDAGLEYIETQDWLRAIQELRSAASLEFEDADMKRIYGTRFIEYFPHRELGVAYYNLKEFETARKELELSIAYASTERAEEYLNLAKNRVPPVRAGEAKRAAEQAENRQGDLERAEREKAARIPPVQPGAESILPPGALTYDPAKVRQVGGRLTLAVMPFQGKGESRNYVEAATDRMVAQLVELRRFKVIERAKLEEVLQEQRLQVSGVVDDRTAVDVGRVAGADAIVVGSVSVIGPTTTVSARVIDTQSSEVIVARNTRADRTNLEDVEKLTENVGIMIYNELPLVQGSVISTEGDVMYIDVGSDKRIRRGARCVAYREMGDLLDPTTGAVIDKKVKMLGEVQVQEVLEKASKVELVRMEAGEAIKVGDKIVVK